MSSPCETIFPIDGVMTETLRATPCFAAFLHIITPRSADDAALRNAFGRSGRPVDSTGALFCHRVPGAKIGRRFVKAPHPVGRSRCNIFCYTPGMVHGRSVSAGMIEPLSPRR